MKPNRTSLNLKEQTQKALKTINQYEKLKKSLAVMSNPDPSLESSRGQAIRNFQLKQKVKLQLLPNFYAYFQLTNDEHLDPKIIIRQFKGGPVELYIYYDKILKDLEKAVSHFQIKDQVILKLEQKYLPYAKTIYLVFKNDKNFTMFNFRMQKMNFKNKLRTVLSQRSMASVSIDSKQKSTPKKLLLRNASSNRIRRIVSLASEPVDQYKPEQKLKKIAEFQAKLMSRQEAAKSRQANIQIYTQKQAQAEKMVSVCKKMVANYHTLAEEQAKIKNQIVKSSATVVHLFRFCLLSSILANGIEKNLKRALMIKNYYKKFIRKIRRAYHQSKELIPDSNTRNLSGLNLLCIAAGNIQNSTSMKRAQDIAIEVIAQVMPGLLINCAMGYSNQYRRVVRRVQKHWRVRFAARTEMLLGEIGNQLRLIVKDYKQFELVQKQFLSLGRDRLICLEYQKQTASKYYESVCAHRHRLAEIEEYKAINFEITNFNKTVSKKKHRQYLEVPSRPAYPQFRFFRDLMFVKSMIRDELQVLLRKFKKKNPTLLPNSPVNGSYSQQRLTTNQSQQK